MITLVIKMVIVAIGHVVLNFWLYGGRVHNKHAILYSDFVVFGLPALVALCAYAYVIWREASRLPAAPRAIVSLLLALVATAVSLEISLYVAFNRYGT